MTFEEHLELTRQPDGTLDVAAAETARAAELAVDEDIIEELAKKAASAERRAWESRNRSILKAEFKKDTFNFGDWNPEAKVPLGGSVVVPLSEMNHERIRIRKDLRVEKHRDENRAFENEMSFWDKAEAVLPPGGTLGDLDG